MYQSGQQMKTIVMKMLTPTHQEHCPLWLPFFLGKVEWVDAPPADFLPPWQLSVLLSKWNFCAKEATPDTSTACFCTLNRNLAFGLALAHFMEDEDWDNPSEDSW